MVGEVYLKQFISEIASFFQEEENSLSSSSVPLVFLGLVRQNARERQRVYLRAAKRAV